MLVVSDTSPLNYLVITDTVHVLTTMYGRVIVPEAVARELLSMDAPQKVRDWMSARPAWLEVHQAPAKIDDSRLDPGEAEATALAKALKADLLLVDERRATMIAREQEGLATTGTLGVLRDAALMGLIDLPAALKRLETETTFHASPTLYQEIIEDFRKRTGKEQDERG